MKKDIFWNSLGTAAWSFSSLILLIIVTRTNGIIDSGLFSFAFAFALVMFTISCYGGRTYQVSDHKNIFTPDDYISVRLFTSLAAVLATLFFVLLNGYDLYKSVLVFMLVGHRVFDAIADVFYGIAQKNSQLHVSGKSLLYKSLLSIAIFLIIDLLTENLLLSVLALPIVSLTFILLYDIPQSKKLENFSVKLKFDETKNVLKSTFLPFIITAMGLIFVNLARYFVDIYHPRLQGYFGIVIMPLSLVILLFSFALTPAILHLTTRYHKKDFHNLHHTVVRIMAILSCTALLLCILVYYFGAPLLHLLFGVGFENYILDIVLVVLIGLAISFTSLFTNIAIIARGLRFTALIYLISTILLGLLCILLVNRYQIRGAISAYIIASVVQAMLMGVYYRYLILHKRSRKS